MLSPKLKISQSKNMKPTYYSEISKGALLVHQQILAAAKDNPEINSLYKGCQLLFSPLFDRPKILLFGFNPGGGYYSWHGRIVEEFQPLQELEYYLNSHPLGEQTKTLFREAGREEDLRYHTAKTNFYYWATDNVADFNRLLKFLPEELSQKIFHQARVWTKQLIDGMRPEMIIAEGLKAYEELAVLFPQRLQEESSEIVRSFETPEGVRVLGYKRNQGSIMNKTDVSIIL